MKEFDYYIFIDYSENLIGYSIIEKDKLRELLPKISRLRHYREAGDRKLYLKNVKKTFKRDCIKSFFLKLKIRKMHKSMEIYLDVLEFLKKHENCIIFISIDNSQYPAFRKMVNIVDGEDVVVKQESELITGTPEYQVSLVLDNLLNIERLKKSKSPCVLPHLKRCGLCGLLDAQDSNSTLKCGVFVKNLDMINYKKVYMVRASVCPIPHNKIWLSSGRVPLYDICAHTNNINFSVWKNGGKK